jgi:hypothetical protein
VLAGVEITSSLRPAAKVDFWFPNSNIPGDVVMGIAGGRRGYEVSLGLGATCSDGDHHADARALVTRARGQTSIGAEFTPYMFMVQRRTWLRFGVGAVHTIGDSRPIEFRWSAGALFHLAH